MKKLANIIGLGRCPTLVGGGNFEGFISKSLQRAFKFFERFFLQYLHFQTSLSLVFLLQTTYSGDFFRQVFSPTVHCFSPLYPGNRRRICLRVSCSIRARRCLFFHVLLLCISFCIKRNQFSVFNLYL